MSNGPDRRITGDGPDGERRIRDGRESRAPNEGPEPLASLVGHLARSQPLRRAPASLEQRVLAQLALQQANVPWWRKGFAHWPLAARAAFLIASYGFVRLTFTGVMSLISFVSSREATGETMTLVHSGTELMSAAASTGSALMHAIPANWLYGAIVVGFALYAVLFGIGTVAYRTLYVER
jgi:hypothetical protein